MEPTTMKSGSQISRHSSAVRWSPQISSLARIRESPAVDGGYCLVAGDLEFQYASARDTLGDLMTVLIITVFNCPTSLPITIVQYIYAHLQHHQCRPYRCRGCCDRSVPCTCSSALSRVPGAAVGCDNIALVITCSRGTDSTW